jgi:hypothetical protein
MTRLLGSENRRECIEMKSENHSWTEGRIGRSGILSHLCVSASSLVQLYNTHLHPHPKPPLRIHTHKSPHFQNPAGLMAWRVSKPSNPLKYVDSKLSFKIKMPTTTRLNYATRPQPGLRLSIMTPLHINAHGHEHNVNPKALPAHPLSQRGIPEQASPPPSLRPHPTPCLPPSPRHHISAIAALHVALLACPLHCLGRNACSLFAQRVVSV